MANDKRFIVKNGLRSQNVEFTDSQDGSNQITLNMLNTDTLNFEGDAGSLFSISDDLTGTVFSVSDISGIPIIEANGDTHNVTFNEFDGKVMIGGTDSGSADSDVLNVTGNVRATAYYGDGSNLTGISASGGTDSAIVSAIITADVDKAFVDALNVDAATATTSTNITAVANNSTNETVYITFVDGATGTQGIETDTALSYNPSSNTLTAGVFSGSGASLTSIPAGQLTGTVSDARLPASISSDITGNATTATALATARNIDITGVTATAQSFDGSGDISIPVTAVPASLLTGTISDARLPASISSDITGNAATADSATAAGSAVQAQNADTLDNISSGSFLRSDAADTKSSGDLTFSDNVEAVFGAGTDLRIFHDGTNSNIINTTGSLIIADTNGDVKIQGKYGEQSIVANNDGSVELYHDNSKKLETTSSGAEVTGDLTLTSTANSGAVLKLVSNDPADAADFGIEGVVQFYAENDASESTLYYSMQLQTADISDGSEDGWLYLNSRKDGALNVANAFGADGSMYILGSGNGGEGALKWFQTRSTSHTVSVKPNTPTASRNIFLPDATGTAMVAVFYDSYSSSNVTLGSSDQVIDFDTNRQNSDTAVFSESAGVITVAKAGTYMMTYDVTTGISSGTSRSECRMAMQRAASGSSEFSDIAGSISRTYNRTLNLDSTTGTATIMYSITAGDQIRVVARRTNGTSTTRLLGGECRFNMMALKIG